MCPRCKKSSSYSLTFKFKVGKENVFLDARVCKVCEYLWADDEELLKTARHHLKALGRLNDTTISPT